MGGLGHWGCHWWAWTARPHFLGTSNHVDFVATLNSASGFQHPGTENRKGRQKTLGSLLCLSIIFHKVLLLSLITGSHHSLSCLKYTLNTGSPQPPRQLPESGVVITDTLNQSGFQYFDYPHREKGRVLPIILKTKPSCSKLWSTINK